MTKYERVIAQIIDEYEDMYDLERVAEDGTCVYELVEAINSIVAQLKTTLDYDD
jgi:hypothetical protein